MVEWCWWKTIYLITVEPRYTTTPLIYDHLVIVTTFFVTKKKANVFLNESTPVITNESQYDRLVNTTKIFWSNGGRINGWCHSCVRLFSGIFLLKTPASVACMSTVSICIHMITISSAITYNILISTFKVLYCHI
jgi:hypothetical protein